MMNEWYQKQKGIGRKKEPKYCVERYCTTGNAMYENFNLERCHSNGSPNHTW